MILLLLPTCISHQKDWQQNRPIEGIAHYLATVVLSFLCVTKLDDGFIYASTIPESPPAPCSLETFSRFNRISISLLSQSSDFDLKIFQNRLTLRSPPISCIQLVIQQPLPTSLTLSPQFQSDSFFKLPIFFEVFYSSSSAVPSLYLCVLLLLTCLFYLVVLFLLSLLDGSSASSFCLLVLCFLSLLFFSLSFLSSASFFFVSFFLPSC